MQHRSAPDDRGIVVGEKCHRHELQAVLLRGNNLLSVRAELRVDAEHDRDVGAVDVAVDHRHAAPHLAQRDRQVHRHRGLANASLTGADGDDVLHARNRRLSQIRRRGRSHLRRHLHVHGGNARQLLNRRPRLIAHLILHRTSRRRQLDRECHAVPVDAKIFHELQRDDVFVKVGIADGTQGVEDFGFGYGHFSDCTRLPASSFARVFFTQCAWGPRLRALTIQARFGETSP